LTFLATLHSSAGTLGSTLKNRFYSRVDFVRNAGKGESKDCGCDERFWYGKKDYGIKKRRPILLRCYLFRFLFSTNTAAGKGLSFCPFSFTKLFG
jgi:hypothetical protein